MPGEVWTPARRQLHGQLIQLDVTLGSLYGYMLNHIQATPESGEERARIVLIAHAIREMTNNLPEALADVDGIPVGRVDTAEPCRNLVAEWDNHADVLDERYSSASDEERVAVPSAVLAAASRIVTSQRAVTGNHRLRQSAVALRQLERGPDPTLEMWLAALSWFERHAHLDKSRERPVPGDGAILLRLEVVENILTARLRGFFNVMTDVAALAELANASVGGTPVADPSPDGEEAK